LNENLLILSALPLAYLLDLVLGDPLWLPHPIVLFGNSISKGEKLLNKGKHKLIKGALLSIILITTSFFIDCIRDIPHAHTWGLM